MFLPINIHLSSIKGIHEKLIDVANLNVTAYKFKYFVMFIPNKIFKMTKFSGEVPLDLFMRRFEESSRKGWV